MVLDQQGNKGNDISSTNEDGDATKPETFGIVLLRSIVDNDPDFAGSLVRILDSGALKALAPQLICAFLKSDNKMLNPKQLITLLEDEPRTLVAVVACLFFPNTELMAAKTSRQHSPDHYLIYQKNVSCPNNKNLCPPSKGVHTNTRGTN